MPVILMKSSGEHKISAVISDKQAIHGPLTFREVLTTISPRAAIGCQAKINFVKKIRLVEIDPTDIDTFYYLCTLIWVTILKNLLFVDADDRTLQ